MPELGVVPAGTRYVALTQQRWCCAPTGVQMVMLRRGIPLVPTGGPPTVITASPPGSMNRPAANG